MASLKSIKKLHKRLGEMDARFISPQLRKWYRATTTYIAREERRLACRNQAALCGIG